MLKVPVVAFDIGGMRDLVVDGLNGALVKPFDTEMLCEAILLWGRKNIEETDRIQKHLAQFREKNVVSMHLDFYKNLIRKKNER